MSFFQAGINTRQLRNIMNRILSKSTLTRGNAIYFFFKRDNNLPQASSV